MRCLCVERATSAVQQLQRVSEQARTHEHPLESASEQQRVQCSRAPHVRLASLRLEIRRQTSASSRVRSQWSEIGWWSSDSACSNERRGSACEFESLVRMCSGSGGGGG